MKSRAYNDKIERHFKKVLSPIIHVPDQHHDIDFLDDDVGIELKCKWTKWSLNYACNLDQLQRYQREHDDVELFWAMLEYDMPGTTNTVKPKTDLSKRITSTTVRFFEYTAHRDFADSKPTAKVAYKYAHTSKFPSDDNFIRHQVKGITLFIPKTAGILEAKLNSPEMIAKYQRYLEAQRVEEPF